MGAPKARQWGATFFSRADLLLLGFGFLRFGQSILETADKILSLEVSCPWFRLVTPLK